MKTAISIDEALVILNRAKKQIGGDKCLILSLTGSGIEDANVQNLHIIDEGENNSRYIEVQVEHPCIQDDDELEEPTMVEVSRDDLVERLGKVLTQMDGESLADLYNREFGEGMAYAGDEFFTQVVEG